MQEASPKKSLPLVGEGFSLLKPFLAVHGFALHEFVRSCGLLKASFGAGFKAVVVVGLPASICKVSRKWSRSCLLM